jgi:cytochrome P450
VSTNTIEALADIYGGGRRSAGGAATGAFFGRSNLYKSVFRKSIGTTTDPEYHAAARKLFAPSFRPSRLKKHEGVIKDCIRSLHGLIMQRMYQGDTLALNDLYFSLSVDMVSGVLLGKTLGCLDRGSW